MFLEKEKQIIKKLLYILSTLVIIAIVAIIFVDTSSSLEKEGMKKHHKFERIISLSPSITETLFALELGDRVVGRTRYCNYPPETENIAEVGGYADPNYEALIALQPDVVILLPEHEKVKKYLEELHINYLEVNNKTVNDILASIKTIGDSCSVTEKSNYLLGKLNKTLTTIRTKTGSLHKPKTIISIGRTMGSGTLKEAYIAGVKTYFSELINLAGGKNALTDSNLAYPKLSAEGLLHLNPKVIVDLVTDLNSSNINKTTVIAEWKGLHNIQAVKNNRIVVLSSDYVVIPGPRFILLLKDLAKAIHPEVKWREK